MPDKKINLSGAKEILSSEGPKLNLSGASDILKKKDQSVAAATGGFGSQLGSQTFQPTKAFVPAPLVGTGVEDYNKEQKAKAQAKKDLSQKLQSQQDIYYQAQGKQSAISMYDNYQSSIKDIDDEISKNYPEAATGPRTQSGAEDFNKYDTKRGQLVSQRDQFSQQSKSALKYINPIIESDINTEFENNGLKKFTRVTSAGFEVPDEYKIDDYAKKYAQQNGVSDNGTFKRLVYDKLKSSVAFNISKPKIQKEFDELFKKEFGVTPDKAIQKDYLDNFAEGEKIKSNLLLQVQSLNKDIKTKLDDGSKLLSLEYKPRLDAITADYQNRVASIELKIKQLNESYKSGIIPKQSYDLAFNNIQNELTVLNSQYKDSFDSVSKEFLNNQNELYSKYDKRYKRQVSEFTNMAEQQIADASSKYGKTFKMSDDLKKKYESVWNKATNKYLTKDEAIKYDLERSFIPGNLGTQFAKNLFIGIGSGIKSISSMYDFDAGYVFGDYMENSVTSSSPEIKTGLDLLDPIKLQSSVGRMLGGMAPVLGASALTAAATKNAPTALRLLATGLGNYIVETAQIGGGIKDTVFQKTGNIADANKAAKKAVDANLYLLPLYALDGLPFLDDVTLGIKNTFARAGAKAGIETLTELPQEYFQNIFEDLAISDKPISDTFKNMTLEKFENTALNVIPTTVLLGGAGTAFKGAKEEIAKIQGRSFAAKFDLFDLTKTAKKQFVYDTVLRRGDVFAKAYVSSLFNSGNINEQELESFSNMIDESNKIIEESKKIGLGKVGSKVYAALKFDYIQSKNEFDSEQDEASKKIYKAKMDSAEKSLNDFVSGKKPDAVVLTLPNNEQYIYSFETLNSIIDEGGDLLNQIIDGDVKVGLLTDKTNPKAKALSDKLNKIKKENAVQEPSTTSEVPSATEGGQFVPEGGEGVGQSIEGTEAPQEAPIQEPTAEIVPEEEVVTEAPEVDKEVERLESDLFRTEIELEDAELEIENEKSILKEEKARIKQAIADVRKSNLSREEKEDKIEDLKYELEDLIDTHDSLVENYRYDIQDAKKEIAKINKKLKKIAQAPVTPVAPTTAKSKGVSSKNKSQLDDLKSRVTNAVKSTVIKTAERAIVTLKSILPGFDIIIHEDEDSYNKATGNPNTRGNFSYNVNPDGTYTGTIDINLNKANERTVAHEVAHAVLLKVFGENTKLFKAFRFKISKILTSSRNKELVKFANLYGTDVKAEEYLVELTSILEQEQDNISPTILQQIAAYINDLVSKLTNGAIKPFENVKDTKDIIDFFNTVSGAIREGKEISEDGSKFKKFGEQVAKGPESKSKFQANFTDDKTGITFSYDENGDLFKELVNKGYITYDKTIEDFLGQSAVFHKPDYAFSGNILKDGVVIIEGQGGIYYPIKYHKDGLFWAASTPEAAKGLVKKINEAAKNSPDGKARLILISTSEEKVFSSYNAAAGIIDVFASKVFDKKFGLNENDIKLALLESAKSNLGLDVNNRQSLKDIINTVKEKLKPENIVNINKRKDFISVGKNNLISKILEQITDTKNVQDLIEFFGKGIKNDKFVGTKTGKLTFANLKQALSYMLNEPILRDEKESDLIYAVLEVPASKDGGDVVTYEKNDSHKSYPYSVVIKDKSAKTTLHILSKKVKWNDYAIDPSTGKTVQKDRLLNIIPTFSGLSVPLSIGSPVSKSQKIDEDLSKASGTTQRSITTGSYVNAANELNKLNIKGRVLDYGAGYGLGTDAMSDILGKPVESYEINSERWKGKKPVTYKQSKNIDGKFDAIVSLNVLNVVPRNTRDFIIQDIYNHLKDGGKAIISSRKFKDDIDRSKNFEVGPEEKSYFVKVKEDGKLIDVYQKGFDGNELVDYVKEVLGNKVDVKKANKGFGATGVIIEKLPVSKSQKIDEENNREALRVAGMPYLENTLNVLSTKFDMPYNVIYDESSDETGYIDYNSYYKPTIIINTANATNDTPLIQYSNIFINQIKNTNKNLFSNLVKQVLNTKEGQAELEFAKERFSNDDYEDQVQQAVVSLLAKYGKNYFDPKTGIHKAIKKVWDTLLDFLSKSFNVNINEIPASTTMEQLSKILSHPNISINKTTYSDEVKGEIAEQSKRALDKVKNDYSYIEGIKNPSIIIMGSNRVITNEEDFNNFYDYIERLVDALKNYKDSQLLVDLTNIKSQISNFEARANFNYDRYPLFTQLLRFIHPNPDTALWLINNSIESGENIQDFINSQTKNLNQPLGDIVYNILSGYNLSKAIVVKPPKTFAIYTSGLETVDEVKSDLIYKMQSLAKAIANPELGADYYRRNIRIPVGDDTYTIRGNYRDGNIDISFSSEKFGMADANEGLFFKILPKVIDAISYMYSDVDYDTISFTPISSDKTTKGTNLRLKGYNIFAKRLFGDFSLLAEDDNTTIIPIPEIFKNRPLTEERTISRSQKVEGEEQAPQKGGPLARIKQAIEKSRKAKAGVGPVSKPVEFEEAEVVPSEKGKANLFKSLNAPARSLNKLKQASEGAGNFFNKVKRAAIDTKYDIAKALTKSNTPIGDIARAAMRNAKGYTGASSLVIKLVNSQIFDRLSFAPNVKIKLIDDKGNTVNTVWSERQLFDAFLDANRIINIDARIRDKFSELVSLSRELKNGIKNESLTKEEQDELVNQISQLKDYLLRRKSLEVKGPNGQVQMIGYQDPNFEYTDKLIDLLKEDYAPIQYTHTDGKTQADAEGILAEMKEQLPELYKTFDKMSSDYYDTFRYLLDESLKNGLITKEVYDELWSYNYIPTKFIQHFIEGELAIDNPSKAKKLSASLKNLTGGSEEDVITNYQYIMELYAHATYRRIFDNRAAVKLAQALGKIDPNKFGKDSQFFIQKPNGKDKKGNPTYSDPEKGYDYIKFMVDGVENRIVAPKQFVDIWYDSEFQSSPWLDSTVNFLSKLTLVEFIKGVFTKYSPVFGVTQFLLDAPQALISTKAYPDFFLGSILLAKDYATVAKDVMSIVRDGKPTKFFVEAVQAGVFSDFVSTENDLIRGEKFTNYDGTDNIKNKIKYLASRVNRGVDKTLESIAKVNEAVEYSTRLAVYYRMKKNLISKFKKDNNGAEPTGQDLENIQLLAAEQSRIVVDFSVSGGVTKQANRLFAYLNSAIQVFVSAARGLKNNPWKAGLMMLEIGAAGTALLAYSLGDLGGEDDEEKKKRYKEYRKRSTYEKESYFLMWTGDPERPFLRIPKPPLFKGLINLFEQAYLNASRGEEFNQEKMWSAFKRDIPFGNPLAELTRNPMINAMFKYFNNYDQFRQENIVKDEEKILDFAETKGATQLYKNIGKASKDLGFKEGVSPKRLQEAVRSFTGDPTKNTWASLFDMGSKGAVALATGDTKELEENFSGNLYADIFKNSGLEGKLFTKPIDYDASFSEQLKEDEKEEYTKKYVIRADVNEIRNNSKDVRSAVKSIYEYLKPKVDSKDIDADYANRVIKQQIKLFGLKDAPEFYDDVAYAKDNDTKAKILNYYLSDMSNAEAGKVMKDMVSKGLLSEEAFLKTINLRAGKK